MYASWLCAPCWCSRWWFVCSRMAHTKQQLDTYAVELVREAEIAGRVGTETTRRAAALTDSTGLDPDIRWSTTGRIQLNDEVTVTLTLETDIGLFQPAQQRRVPWRREGQQIPPLV